MTNCNFKLEKYIFGGIFFKLMVFKVVFEKKTIKSRQIGNYVRANKKIPKYIITSQLVKQK